MTIWYVARGTGLAALLLLTVTTALGAAMSERGSAANRVVVSYVHRVTASLGIGALLLHVGTILADSYAGVGWHGALVPFTSGYRPNWVALGTFAAYTLVLVAAIGFARGRIARSARGVKAWRWTHALGYVAWGLAMLHGLNAGSDTSLGWVRLLYLGCGAAVVGALVLRLSPRRVHHPSLGMEMGTGAHR